MLLNRDYKQSIINVAIRKEKHLQRKEALKRVVKDKSETRRPVLVVTYDPRLPAITTMVNKHWRAMCREDPYLKEVFPKPPLVAYRRQKTTGNYLIRAKLPGPDTRIKRKLPGMHRCLKSGRECAICPWVQEGKIAKSSSNMYRKEITSHLTCQSSNVVYIITCIKCNLQYVGETDHTLKERFSEHNGYVRTKKVSQTTGAHFNLPGHSIDDMRIMAIEKISDRGPQNRGPQYRKEMEKENIANFNTYHRGLNKTPGG